jgi:hypothetical protein
MTVEKMQQLVQTHADCETQLDLEGVLATLVDHPVYEFPLDRLRLEGQDNIRQFYRDHFNFFFPLIKSHALINASWDQHSVCFEYDLRLHDSDQDYRIMVVMTEKNGLLVGERFYVETELAQLMAGPSYENFVKF